MAWISSLDDYRINMNKVLNVNMVAKPVTKDSRDKDYESDDDESFEVNLIKTAIDLEVLTEDEGAIRLEEIRRVKKDKEEAVVVSWFALANCQDCVERCFHFHSTLVEPSVQRLVGQQ